MKGEVDIGWRAGGREEEFRREKLRDGRRKGEMDGR